MKTPGNSKYVKKLNRMNIINMIKECEPISRQEIAEMTGLTPAAITGIIRDLIEMGFTQEEGLGESQGGRRPVKLTFNRKAGYVIGMEVTSQEITIAIADLKRATEFIESIKFDMKDTAAALEMIVRTVEHLVHKQHKNKKFLGIAIAFPASLTNAGVVKRAVNLGSKWNGIPLKEVLENRLKLPVFIDTNSKVAALGERWFGGGVKCKNLIYINMGEGISAGIILNDSIMQGAHGYGGQIGHTVILEQGPLCNCGNRGCLEAVCGVPALLGKANREIPFIDSGDTLKQRYELTGEIEISDILEVALSEDSYAREIVRQAARHLALVTAGMINFYNPEKVFLGGKLAVAADIFLDEFRKIARTHVFPEIWKTTEIVKSKLGTDAGVTGACALVLKNLLHSPNSIIFQDQSEMTALSQKVL